MGIIKLDFTPTIGSQGVKILRDNIEIHDLTPVTVGSVNTWTDNNAPDSVLTTYKVRPYNANLEINTNDTTGNTESITPVFVDTQAPSQVLNLVSSSFTETAFTLGWDASTDNVGVTGYTVNKDGILLQDVGNVLTYNVTGLIVSQSYDWTVNAYDLAGNFSVTSSVMTILQPDLTAPSQPTGLAEFNVTTSSFDLTWVDSTDNVGVTGYSINRNGTYYTGSVSNSQFIDNQISGSINTWTVNAFDNAGNYSVTSSGLDVEQTGSAVSSTLLNGLSQYFKLDETSGTTVNSSTGSETGVVGGTMATNGTGLINKSLWTNTMGDGTGDALTINSRLDIDDGTPKTLNVWIKANTDSQYWIFSNNSSGRPAWYIYRSGSTIIFLATHTSSATSLSFTVPYTYNSNWTMFSLTTTGNLPLAQSDIEVYINGVKQTKTVTKDTLTSSTGIAKNHVVGDYQGNSLFNVNGIDEYGVWNRILTDVEVTELYNSGAGIQYPF